MHSLYETFIVDFLRALMSEAGVVAILLLAACEYLRRQLKEARAEIKLQTNQILQLATSSIATMKEVEGVLESMVEKLGSPNREK